MGPVTVGQVYHLLKGYTRPDDDGNWCGDDYKALNVEGVQALCVEICKAMPEQLVGATRVTTVDRNFPVKVSIPTMSMDKKYDSGSQTPEEHAKSARFGEISLTLREYISSIKFSPKFQTELPDWASLARLLALAIWPDMISLSVDHLTEVGRAGQFWRSLLNPERDWKCLIIGISERAFIRAEGKDDELIDGVLIPAHTLVELTMSFGSALELP